jgi:phage tail-like protein
LTDFADLFYGLLPGIYRQKDERGDLQRFIQIMASPPAELETSIGQLYLDLFVETCRPDFLPFIGDLIGADVDPSDPPSVQRAGLATTFAFYRSKGLAAPLASVVQTLSTWTTTAVDFSSVVARVPFVEALEVLQRRRRQPVAEPSPGSGRFFFAADQSVTPLYDAQRGRPIARAEIASLAGTVVGTDAGFSIYVRGAPVVGASADPTVALAAVGADLTNFASPQAAGGGPLALGPGQVAVDPTLGRFLIASPRPLAADTSVDFHQLAPHATTVQTFDIRDSARMERLLRSDDPAPYTLDIRSAARPTDVIGRTHFDNHGFFMTVGTQVASQRPNLVVPGTFSGFTFDGRPLDPADTVGNPLQLQDGIDGAPLTRRRLAGNEAAFFDTPRGFVIRDLGVSLTDPSFPVAVRVRAADLTSFAAPKDPGGAALALAPTDVAVDPQLGRFLVDLAALGTTADRLRVGFLLAPVVTTRGARPVALAPPPSTAYAFAADGAAAPLRDALDGTPLAMKLRLGAAISDFHGTARGYRVSRNGSDVTGTLTALLLSLPTGAVLVAPGLLAVDLDRGRFALPIGFLGPADVVSVDFAAEDRAATGRAFARVAGRMPRMIPAGVTPVLVDTRRPKVDPSTLE